MSFISKIQMSMPPPLRKIIYFLLNLFNGKESGTIINRPLKNLKKAPQSFYSLKMTDIDGQELNFSDFKGKKVLLVNTASACGYTAQYSYLEKLYKQYRSKLIVIGFPCNDFGKQEPGPPGEIKKFCIEKYQVTFPLSEKISVKGENLYPVYQWLTNPELNGWNHVSPGWNFCKYLVDENGELLSFFSEKISPFDDSVIKKLDS